ncbi:MAG TPA: YdjY domain-containing protein [Kiritimatiellia bacterium]|nr:YdjY domain-containing protein [Kiritimatiellia bacterium]
MCVMQGVRLTVLLCGIGLVAGCQSRGRLLTRIEPEGQPVMIGGVQAYPESRMLVISGYVNQVVGAIELLACSPRGKVHESVFVLWARPLDMQSALLLLGYRHGPPMAGLGQGPPVGDPVEVWVQWTDEAGRDHLRRGEEFMFSLRDAKPLRRERWIFNGSTFEDGLFMAGAEDSLVATYWDPWAILNLESDLGAADTWVVVNTNTVPPLHTSIRFMVRPGS